ncbi:dihydrofolate reductase family protein [Nonomuraea rubra]|uniref:Dihydrofolate reductase n=2 Tax=Nonomuraea rubra TaxID=46180 RepID=A0A7X0NS29_9ACTN|nr:dihydrofolate reductase family protein [Nonomuraea rubra]MBB6548574.1 dihydrofolate reductase [Nonomuraea rubra]
MRKLVESTFVTLDGVIGDPHIWGPAYWDEEHNAYSAKLLFGADALLLGRETYEGFAEAWGSRSGDEYTDRINSLPKYVASTTLKEATAWNGNLIEGDVATAVAELKQQPGQSILKYGSGKLDRTLIANKLIDELHLWVFPVVAGGGDRLLDGLDLTHFELLETTRFKSGIIVLTYGPKA